MEVDLTRLSRRQRKSLLEVQEKFVKKCSKEANDAKNFHAQAVQALVEIRKSLHVPPLPRP